MEHDQKCERRLILGMAQEKMRFFGDEREHVLSEAMPFGVACGCRGRAFRVGGLLAHELIEGLIDYIWDRRRGQVDSSIVNQMGKGGITGHDLSGEERSGEERSGEGRVIAVDFLKRVRIS